jgi:multidrug efflux system membrane fusion protein
MLAPRPLLLALPFLLTACFERAQPTVENQPRPVQALRVTAAAEAAPRLYPGTIRPRREADLGFRAPGRLLTREVDAGTRVAAGQLLARLDPADLALNLRAAEADLSGAEAAAVQTAAEAARSRTLAAQGWNAAATDEQKQAAARTAAQKVESARAALELSRNRLAYAELRAPSAGVVTAILADRGTVLPEGTPVLRLAEADTLEVEIQLPETALAEAERAGATLSLWSRPGPPLPARLREVAAAATPGLRSYTARYTIPTPPDWLAIGMTATIALPGALPPGLAALPTAALADRGAGPIVWVIDPAAGTVAARPVRIATLGQDRAQVAGVTPGELIVAFGVHRLDPAARIRVLAPE